MAAMSFFTLSSGNLGAGTKRLCSQQVQAKCKLGVLDNLLEELEGAMRDHWEEIAFCIQASGELGRSGTCMLAALRIEVLL